MLWVETKQGPCVRLVLQGNIRKHSKLKKLKKYITEYIYIICFWIFVHINNICIEYFILLYGFGESCILIGRRTVRKNPYPDRGPYFSVSGPAFYEEFVAAIFTHIFKLKDFSRRRAFTKNEDEYSPSDFYYPDVTRSHVNASAEAMGCLPGLFMNMKKKLESYNKQLIDIACSVCTVKYRTLVF